MLGLSVQYMLMVFLFHFSIQDFVCCQEKFANIDTKIQENQISSLNAIIAKQNDMLAMMNEKIDHITSKMKHVTIEIEEMKERLDRNNVDNHISFTAYATSGRAYGPNEKVIFDHIVRDYGSGYDAVDSSFLCTVRGFYLFSVAVLGDYGTYMVAQIMIDDGVLVEAYSRDDSTRSQGANLAVTSCDIGQKVWISASGDSDNRISGGPSSSFTGTLLSLA